MADTDLALIGCGNMGMAIVRGAIAKGVLRADRVLGIDPLPEARALATALGLRASDDPGLARGAARVLLAVKPQSFEALAKSLAPLSDSCEVISVMSGWTRARIAAALGQSDGAARVIRAMPNLPATIGAGVTAVARQDASTATRHNRGSPVFVFAESLFRAVGDVVFVDEALLDAVTALSGSGPAYVLLLAESMLVAAQRLGFDDVTARQLVIGTIGGAAALLRGDDRSPADLRAAVTSRGGTTEAATKIWKEREVPHGIVDAILAAAARATELGRAGSSPPRQ